jgi:diol dehydratase reactivase alpha subunit
MKKEESSGLKGDCMKLIAGVDIGNSTTEVCIGEINDDGAVHFLSDSMTSTTGAKGTEENVKGIIKALELAMEKLSMKVSQLDVIRLNEASPVIGDTAMETITQTVITESAMIGHNPDTPGGQGIGCGETLRAENEEQAKEHKKYILIVPKTIGYEEAARRINRLFKKGIKVAGVIAQADEGVLICNRLQKPIPIVDEVQYIDKVPQGMQGVIEVAKTGETIRNLSNPYDIASLLKLTPEETKYAVPVAKSLMGNRSAVVIKTPGGDVKERIIPAGTLTIIGEKKTETIGVDSGAESIMSLAGECFPIKDVEGESGTNMGGMISTVKDVMAKLTYQSISDIKIKDILAVDTMLPVKVDGGLAGEAYMEKAVAMAAMVKTHRLPMNRIAEKVEKQTGVFVQIAGVEAVMASLGALTTPGAALPIAMLDLGGGSSDGAVMDQTGKISSIHLAGAGELVTMLINAELGLENKATAELIKKYPAARVENLFQITIENGETRFFDSPLDSRFYGRVVVLCPDGMVPVLKDISVEKIVHVRKSAKERVFVENTLRALKMVAPMNSIRNIPNVVLVGGSSEDFEIPELIMNALSKFKVVCGRGNIRSSKGPRNAVATGLVMSYSGR